MKKMIFVGILAGIISISSVALAKNEATFDFGTGVLNIPKVDVGSVYYNVEMQQQGQGLDFSVTDAVASTSSSLENVATYDAGTGIVNIPTVIVGADSYTVGMAQGQGLNFSVTNVTELNQTVTPNNIVNIVDYFPLCEGSEIEYQTGNSYYPLMRRTVLSQETFNNSPVMPMTVVTDNYDKISTYYRGNDAQTGHSIYGAKLCKNGDCETSQFIPPYSIPAQVTLGNSYSWTGSVEVEGVVVETMTITDTIEPGGSITTPGGTFTDTIKITSRFDTANPDDYNVELWAKGVGIVWHKENQSDGVEEFNGGIVCGTDIGQ